MGDNVERLRIEGLDRLEVREVRRDLGGEVTFEEQQLTADKAGEPATIAAVVVLSAIAIKALAQFMMKQRHRGRCQFRFERVRGEERFVTEVSIDDSSSTSSADVIKQLGSALKLDQDLVMEALRPG